MGDLPIVSIITPSYNQGEFLEETIQSVLNQNYKNIEYIIIDGASTDGSVEIIKKYQEKIAYWVSEKDKGQADAINKGFLKATGDFLCWVNSDDMIYPDFITRRINEFNCFPSIAMIYGDVEQGHTIENSWLRKGKITSYRKMLKTLDIPIPQQSSIWRRKVLTTTGMLDDRWHVLLDRDYFIRIARNHQILYIPGKVGFFRIHGLSKSINEATKWCDELPLYYSSLIDDYKEYKIHRKAVLSHCYYYCSNIYFENDEYEKGKIFRIRSRKESLFTYGQIMLIEHMVKVKHFIKRKKKDPKTKQRH
jgi:glycosyltransferase involved in cell wall biosynthesis